MSIPTNTVKLGFDPAKSENPEIKEIFENRVARNLWIGIKTGHLVSDRFNRDCLNIADAIKQDPPATVEGLLTIFLICTADPVYQGAFSRDSVKELAESLMPYVVGNQDFAYEVVTG